MDSTNRGINDLMLVSYLIAAGLKQSSLPEIKGTYLQFYFEPSTQLEAAIEKFYLRQTSVDALTLLEANRTVKAWAIEAKRRNKGGDRHDGR
jgi:triphosphoribosyl-dephospho-CoA synthetase